MGSPISPMEAIQIVQKAVALYQKIRVDAPEQIEKVGKRMQRLETYLLGLQELLDDKSRHSLASLRPAQKKELRDIIGEIKADSEKVYEILNRWNNNIGPFGFQLRFTSVAQALFAVGSSPDKLDSLTEAIEQHKQDLRDFLQLMGYFGINQLLPLNPQQIGAMRAPSPAPDAAGKEYSIIFIDPQNLGRSKVAEAYVHLLREWTVRTKCAWRIKLVHSAGMRVQNRSDCVEILQSMQPPVPIVNGNWKADEVAMASLFGNPNFNYQYKSDIQNAFSKHRSRGIHQDIFQKYDFIVVFVGREYENMLRFKKVLIDKRGKQIAPKGKGRIMHLGSFLSKNGKPVEIVDAPKNKDGSSDRSNWNKTTGEIKVAIKTFLKSEVGWKQPPKGDSQS